MWTRSPTPVTTIIMPVDSLSRVMPISRLKVPTFIHGNERLPGFPRRRMAMTKVAAAEAVETRWANPSLRMTSWLETAARRGRMSRSQAMVVCGEDGGRGGGIPSMNFGISGSETRGQAVRG